MNANFKNMLIVSIIAGFVLNTLVGAGATLRVAQEDGLSVAHRDEQLILDINLPGDVRQQAPSRAIVRVVDHREDLIQGESIRIHRKNFDKLEVPLEIHKNGFFRVNAEIHGGNGEILFKDHTSCAVVPDVELDAPQPDSPFGIGAYYVVRFNPGELEIATRLQKRLGAAWDRDELLWDLCEPRKGEWQWERFDRSIAACRENHILILGLLDYWGKWTTPLTEQGYKDYAHYAKTMVERYKPGGTYPGAQSWKDEYGISHWEIWNEPATFFTGSGEQFGKLLAHASEAIKSADPDAQVFFANWGEKFDTAVINTAGKDSFDGVSPHFYCPPRSPEEGMVDKGMQQTVEFYHGKNIDVPFWITEMGWPTDNTLRRQNEQARYLVRSYVMALASRMDKIFWYNFVNDGRDKTKVEFGVVNREDFTPKVAYPAYCAMVEQLDTATFSKRVPTPQPLRAYVLKAPGSGSVAVLWSLNAEGSLTIEGDERPLQVYDIMGNLLPLPRPRTKTYTLPLSPEPIYVTTGLEPDAFTQKIAAGELRGIALLNLEILPLIGSLDGGTTVRVKVENYAKTPLSGTLEIDPPEGWKAQNAKVAFENVPPSGTDIVGFDFSQCVRNQKNVYPLTITARTEAGAEMTAEGEVSELVATKGSPQIDGTLSDWDNARWVYLNKESQAVGLKPYMDWNLSARVATMWDDKGFYFAAQVTDNNFHQPYSGHAVWQGDCFQVAFDAAHNQGEQMEHPGEYLYGLALTAGGEQVFRWKGGEEKPALVEDVQLKVVKKEKNTWVYESFFPKSTLEPLTFEPGEQFGLSFILNDNDGGGRAGWLEWTTGIGTGYNSKYFTTWTLNSSEQ